MNFSSKFKEFRDVKLPNRKQFMEGIDADNRSYRLTTLDRMAMDGLGKMDDDIIWDTEMIEFQC